MIVNGNEYATINILVSDENENYCAVKRKLVVYLENHSLVLALDYI